MDFFQTIFLALLQGLTEFLPISISAHLLLPSEVWGWPDQGLAFDVAVHVGTLLAVVHYFRRDIYSLSSAWFTTGFSRSINQPAQLAWFIILATIPAGLCGLFLDDWIEQNLRSSLVIATTTITFGLLLWFADRSASQRLALSDMTLMIALVIGFSQVLAFVPGTSRSGITITAALLLGLRSSEAARFSFLLSIPLITAAGLFKGAELMTAEVAIDWLHIAIGISVAGISAWVCIHYFLVFINRIGLLPFVIYRLILGGLLLLWV